MKSEKNTGTKNATVQQLAELNSQIQALNQQKTALAGPMKETHATLRAQLLELETEIRELDPSWKPAGRQKPEEKIAEVITAHGSAMTIEEINQAVNGAIGSWKLKTTLRKRSTGPKAIFTLADGKYSLKSA